MTLNREAAQERERLRRALDGYAADDLRSGSPSARTRASGRGGSDGEEWR